MHPLHPPSSAAAVLHSLHPADEEGNYQNSADQDSADQNGSDPAGTNKQQNTTPEPIVPHRLQRQPPSRQGQVAYVIYGGRGSEARVYYNWYSFIIYILDLPTFIIPYRGSCKAVIQRYFRNSAPPYMGFNVEEQAQTSFADFQASGQLPVGLFPPTSLRPLNSTPVPSSQSPPLLSPHHPGTPSFPCTIVNPTLLCTPHTPVRVAREVLNVSTSETPVRPTPRMRGNLESMSNSPRHDPLLPIAIPMSSIQSFYVVIEGDAPGVYGMQ